MTNFRSATRPVGPVDAISEGEGHQVLLLHSSVAGARQWRKLSADLSGSFNVIAANLIGYGTNPPWAEDRPQTLEDQAALARAALPDRSAPVHIVGHSFGGSVAMALAAQGDINIASLILIEPNPFFLLQAAGRSEAYADAMALRRVVKSGQSSESWTKAAAFFADYWNGEGTWDAMPTNRRQSFVSALKPNFHEWDAVTTAPHILPDFVSTLPKDTLIVYDPGTVPSILGLVDLFREATPWRFLMLRDGGHMAPLTRPDLVNPLIANELNGT